MAKRPTYAIAERYRLGMGAVVRNMLAEIGVTPENIRFHVTGEVSVTVSEAQLETMRAELEGMVEYTVHSNNGEIRISTPETDEYFENNSPILTAEEKAARESSGGGGVSKAEADKRRAALEERRKRAAKLHGLDLQD
jgi:hypothetical protein